MASLIFQGTWPEMTRPETGAGANGNIHNSKPISTDRTQLIESWLWCGEKKAGLFFLELKKLEVNCGSDTFQSVTSRGCLPFTTECPQPSNGDNKTRLTAQSETICAKSPKPSARPRLVFCVSFLLYFLFFTIILSFLKYLFSKLFYT